MLTANKLLLARQQQQQDWRCMGLSEIPIERDKRTGCLWRSAPQSTKRQGAKIQRTPTSLHLTRSFYIHSLFQNYCIISQYFKKFSTHYINLFHCARYLKFHGWLHARTSLSTYLLYWPQTTAFAFGFVLPDSPIKSVYAFPSFLMQATCPAYLTL